MKAEKERYSTESKLQEAECSKFKALFESEQKQHQNTQRVLAETVTKVKESIKSINKRASEKDVIIKRLEQRLQLYKQHLDRHLMQQKQTNQSLHSNNSAGIKTV